MKKGKITTGRVHLYKILIYRLENKLMEAQDRETNIISKLSATEQEIKSLRLLITSEESLKVFILLISVTINLGDGNNQKRI